VLDTVVYAFVDLHNASSLQHKAACYPMPAKDNITILLPYSGKQHFTLSIYNQTGKMVMSKKGITNDRIFLNVKELNRGAYIYRVSTDEHFYTGQMLIY